MHQSGSKAKRPILDIIIKRVKAGDLGGIVVAKLDRLSRLSPRDRVAVFEEIESAGGVVLSPQVSSWTLRPLRDALLARFS